MKHLVDRFREGRISVGDFDALQDWLNSNPEVPTGKWYKQFPKFTLAGEGAVPRTFLTPGMIRHGTEVKMTPVRPQRRQATSRRSQLF